MSSTITDLTAAPRIGGRGVLESAFALLGALERGGAAGVTRLAAECGLPKSTAHRLLEQLTGLGAVERSRGGYRIGARVFQLGYSWQPHPALRAAVREPMRRLADATGVAVSVNVLRNGDDMIVDWVPGRDGLAAPLGCGATWPWTTASGKVQVAAARVSTGTRSAAGVRAEAEAGAGLSSLLGPLPGLPPGLPGRAAPASWRREAAAIRDRGVAFDREDVIPGICCAAVPLYGSAGVPMATMCVITDPAHNLDRLADVLKNAGRAASAALR